MWEPALAGWHAPDKVWRVPRQGSVSPCACSSLLARPVGGRYLHLRHGGAWHGRPLPLRLRLGEGARAPPTPLLCAPPPRGLPGGGERTRSCSRTRSFFCSVARGATYQRDLPAPEPKPESRNRTGTAREPELESRRAGESESHGAEEPKSQPKPEPEY